MVGAKLTYNQTLIDVGLTDLEEWCWTQEIARMTVPAVGMDLGF
jgi:hypothetical protein